MARADIDYDIEDFGLDIDGLMAKYGSGTNEHPVIKRTAYAAYAAMPTRDVKLPYWAWVAREIKKDADANPDLGAQQPSDPAERLSEQQAEDAELVDIESIDQFAGMVAHWHGNKIAILEHFLRMPPGQEGTLNLEGEPEVVVKLEGEAYNGFRLGLVTALIQFSNLPFAVSVADAINPPVAGDASPTQH